MIRFENIPDTEHGQDFKAECRLILKDVFPAPQKASLFVDNIELLNESIKGELKKRGYVYNRANLTFDPIAKPGDGEPVQGNLCAEKSVGRWAGNPMTAYFTIPYEDGPDGTAGMISEFGR